MNVDSDVPVFLSVCSKTFPVHCLHMKMTANLLSLDYEKIQGILPGGKINASAHMDLDHIKLEGTYQTVTQQQWNIIIIIIQGVQ